MNTLRIDCITPFSAYNHYLFFIFLPFLNLNTFLFGKVLSLFVLTLYLSNIFAWRFDEKQKSRRAQNKKKVMEVEIEQEVMMISLLWVEVLFYKVIM